MYELTIYNLECFFDQLKFYNDVYRAGDLHGSQMPQGGTHGRTLRANSGLRDPDGEETQ